MFQLLLETVSALVVGSGFVPRFGYQSPLFFVSDINHYFSSFKDGSSWIELYSC